MGASFCTVFQGDVAPHGTLGADHGTLLRLKERRDQVAADNGPTPLGAFESYGASDTAAFMDPEELAEELPPAEWFPASAGLIAVHALRAHAAAHADAISRAVEVVADLQSSTPLQIGVARATAANQSGSWLTGKKAPENRNMGITPNR